MDIVEATRSYEHWLGAQCAVVRRDLRHKHKRMTESPLVFLRGTFYRWIQVWAERCPSVADAAGLLAHRVA